MRKFTKSAIALLLSFILIISSATPIFAVSKDSSGQPLQYSSEYNSGERDVVCTTLDGTSASSYYTGSYTYENLMSLSSSALKSTLHTLMTSTHKYTSSYNDCHYKADRTDCENENRRVSLLYTQYSATMDDYISGSTGWNREHVWPKSLGGDSESGGGADLHHIRPDDNKTNSTRGSLKFGEVNGGSPVNGSSTVGSLTGGYVGGGYMEPHDNVKGDVARICLYVMVRWDSEWGATSITQVFQSVDVLLEWCEMDPVDTWEMGRNEVVQDIQGNRNVFIDYPEFAWLIYGREIPADMTTPSGNSSALDPSCPHTSTTIKNQVSATCGKDGYTGDTYCTSCNGKLQSGTKISATGNHSFSAWVESGTTQTRTCTICGKTESQQIECKHASTAVRNAVAETCGKDGYTGDTYCLICGSTVQKGTTISKTGIHSYNEWQINVSANTKTRSCYICGHSETVSADLENCTHENTELRNQVAATCGKAGYTGDECCTVCYQVVVKGTAIAATGNHNFGEVVIIVAPTYIHEGSGKQACSDCDEVKTVTLSPLATDGELTVEQLISCLDSDAEKILLLLTLGMTDRFFVDAISK
ncbi:MAG: hypothetical protein E7676_00710 [Ruminococcaceae bacterium]|nr:hypothetical protein [Oscillospiraceae bacterium]